MQTDINSKCGKCQIIGRDKGEGRAKGKFVCGRRREIEIFEERGI
jgi:hypothetical protein